MVPTQDSATIREQPGEQIGRYKLLQRIGEGGFGVVYMAEQEKPVRRKVALKVIKAGMDTTEVIARFEAERQALALMEHPNIAKVLDEWPEWIPNADSQQQPQGFVVDEATSPTLQSAIRNPQSGRGAGYCGKDS